MVTFVDDKALAFLDDRIGDKTGTQRQSIFQQMGVNTYSPMTAFEAYQVYGDYRVDIRPFKEDVQVWENGRLVTKTVDSDFRGIYIKDMHGADVRLGEVKGRYAPIQPSQIVQLWDRYVKKPVVAMGSAGTLGQTFFLSSELGEMDIKGDMTTVYLVGESPMTGKGSIKVRITPVRHKCANMMQVAAARSVMTKNIPHTGQVLDNVGAWMSHLNTDIAARYQRIKQELHQMIETPVKVEDFTWFTETLFAKPEPPSEIGSTKDVERRKKEFKAHTSMAERRQGELKLLYEGRMTGAEDLDESVYRLYQAAAELIQYRRGEKTVAKRAEQVLFGGRADAIARAYELSMQLVRARR